MATTSAVLPAAFLHRGLPVAPLRFTHLPRVGCGFIYPQLRSATKTMSARGPPESPQRRERAVAAYNVAITAMTPNVNAARKRVAWRLLICSS